MSTDDNRYTQSPPLEVVVIDGEMLETSKADDDTVTLGTTDESDTMAQYVEVSPGNYFKIVESRWESERCLMDESAKSPRRDPYSVQRPFRRGSLVMTLMQEDTSRREHVASPEKPTLPRRRASLAMSLESTECIFEAQGIMPDISCRSSFASTIPVRPSRRASLVMNVSPVPEATGSPRVPFRRGSLVLTVSDLGYEPHATVEAPKELRRAVSLCSEPPKYPFRKGSMDVCRSHECSETPFPVPSSDSLYKPPKLPFRKASRRVSEAEGTPTRENPGRRQLHNAFAQLESDQLVSMSCEDPRASQATEAISRLRVLDVRILNKGSCDVASHASKSSQGRRLVLNFNGGDQNILAEPSTFKPGHIRMKLAGYQLLQDVDSKSHKPTSLLPHHACSSVDVANVAA